MEPSCTEGKQTILIDEIVFIGFRSNHANGHNRSSVPVGNFAEPGVRRYRKIRFPFNPFCRFPIARDDAVRIIPRIPGVFPSLSLPPPARQWVRVISCMLTDKTKTP